MSRREHDPAGRLSRQVDAAGNEVRCSYDADGNRTAVTAADGTRTGYGYDPAGGLISAQHPLLGIVRLTRDNTGRLT